MIRDGTLVHDSSHEIQSRDRNFINEAVADCDWGSTPGDYTVRARVDGNDWIEESITEFLTSRDTDYAVEAAEYYESGLRFFLGDCNHKIR